jgi:ABC-type phosphate/phosphonate transport system substrate-binding protein
MGKKIFSLFFCVILITTSISGCLENEDKERSLGKLIIAYEINEDSQKIDSNPVMLSEYLTEKLNYDVSIFSVYSEGAMIEALRFGNADIAIMDAGSAWIGWQQYDLEVMAADLNVDDRTYYNANAWVRSESDIAKAFLDDDPYSDPFELLSGKASCHTGWLNSVGMLLPMGFLVGHGYANVIGDPNDVETIRNTIYEYFDTNSTIPEIGTPYYGHSGALRCLSEGVGDVAFIEENTVEVLCNNNLEEENEFWCLEKDEYVALPAFGQSPSNSVVYNPSELDYNLTNDIAEVLVNMKYDPNAFDILNNILNTQGFEAVNATSHLGSYSKLIYNIPGISAYYNDKYTLNSTLSSSIEKVRIAIKTDISDNDNNNTRIFSEYLQSILGVEVDINYLNSEGEILKLLKSGNLDLAILSSSSAAWIAWKELELVAMAAMQGMNERTYYSTTAYVKIDSNIASALLDDDDDTNPYSLLEGTTSCHSEWMSLTGMVLPVGHLIDNGYISNIDDTKNIDQLNTTIFNFFNLNSSIPENDSPYYGNSGALKCLSDNYGDIAFVEEGYIEFYCENENEEDNLDWCLDSSEYINLPFNIKNPTSTVIYNPQNLDVQSRTAILNAFASLNFEMYLENYSFSGETHTGCYDISIHVIDEESDRETCGSEILENIFNSSGVVRVTSQEHLGHFSNLLSNIPGISEYYIQYFEILGEE